MNNQIFDSFERTEFSDEIFAIFGRVLTLATRFDSTCKTLARQPLYKVLLITKHSLSNDEYNEMVQKISNKYNNTNRAIESLKPTEDIKVILNEARESRNELIHEATLGDMSGFDHMDSNELSILLNHIENLVLKIIKGDALISTLISIQNKELVSDYQFSQKYEKRYINWVMERFEKE